MVSNDAYSLIVGFLWGMFMGPMSSGFVYLFISTIVLEAYAAIITAHNVYRAEMRIAITAAAVMGWIFGRWLVLGETGVENLIGLPEQVLT